MAHLWLKRQAGCGVYCESCRTPGGAMAAAVLHQARDGGGIGALFTTRDQLRGAQIP